MVVVAMIAVAGQRPSARDITAPNVEMLGARGERVRLSDFRGRIVLVEFWASWCPECHLSFPKLDELARDFQGKGVEVIALNVDERRQDADAFLKTHPHKVRVLFDPRVRAMAAFDAVGVPTTYIIDRRGTIRYTHDGYDENASAAFRKQIAELLAQTSR